MYTNICSLNANAKHLDILLDQLDFSFDLLAVLETWAANRRMLKISQDLKTASHLLGQKGLQLKVGAVSTQDKENIIKEKTWHQLF